MSLPSKPIHWSRSQYQVATICKELGWGSKSHNNPTYYKILSDDAGNYLKEYRNTARYRREADVEAIEECWHNFYAEKKDKFFPHVESNAEGIPASKE